MLAVNNGPNHLHGGLVGFDKVVWDAEVVDDTRGPAVRLRYVSQDGEEGYPGTVPVSVTYTLTHDDALVITYEATTDKPTPINLTNHSYFNLAGSGPVLGHILTLHARYYTEPDANQVPTGRILPVTGTPLDFGKPAAIGGRIGQIGQVGGYDHNYVLDNGGRAEPGLAAEVYEPESGRVMELYTTEPGVQFYSAIHLNGVKGKGGTLYNQYPRPVPRDSALSRLDQSAGLSVGDIASGRDLPDGYNPQVFDAVRSRFCSAGGL